MSEIWVWAEQRNETLMDVSLGLMAKGSQLAKELKGELAAVLMGHGIEGLGEELIAYGAEKVYLTEDPRLRLYQSDVYARIIADVIEQHQPEIFIFGDTATGVDLASRVAAKVRTGLTSHCVDLQIEQTDNGPCLVATVPGFSGNLMGKIACPKKRPQMATVKPGIMGNPNKDVKRVGKVIRVQADIHDEEFRAQTIEMEEQALRGIPLEDAETVVAGGWGMKAAGGFKLVEELAEVLHGAVAGTRPAVEAGWISEERMLGSSGKTVSPDLLVTIGASGQIQFTSGFLKSKVILAINDNPHSPIFEVCDIGLVGDLRQVVPCLIEELKKTRS